MTFQGKFEGHLTVGTQDRGEFLRAVDGLGIKTVMVELEGVQDIPHPIHQGTHPIQLMTASWHDGTLDQAMAEIDDIQRSLEDRGLEVVRRKVECTLTTQGVPRRDSEVLNLPQRYFEQHFDVPYVEDDPNAALLRVCQAHGAKISRILTPHGHVQGVRYLSVRRAEMGLSRVSRLTREFVTDLLKIQRKPYKVHSEFNILDTNPGLDHGWA